MIRGSIQLLPCSIASPRCVKIKPIRALSDAILMSW
jgi:hypothetical protein